MTTTYQITIAEQDGYWFAYQNGKMVRLAFHSSNIPREYHNLFAAAPLMYEKLDKFAQHAHRMQAMLATLQESHATLPGHAQLFANLESLFQHVKQDFLLTMRVAEVGYKKALTDSASSA